MSSSWDMKQGPNFAPAYQVSGTPYVTGSASSTELNTTPVKIVFPYVTRWIQIRNWSGSTGKLRVGFTEHGVNGTVTNNYYLLDESAGGKAHSLADTDRWEIRCKEIYLRADNGSNPTGFNLVAGLTGIESFPVLTGSNGFKGVG